MALGRDIRRPDRFEDHPLPAALAPARYDNRPPARRRIAALALGIEALLLLAIIALNDRPPSGGPAQGGLATFDVTAEDAGAKAEEIARPKPVDSAPTPRPPRPVPPPPKVVLPDRPLPMIELTREEYRAADIAKLGRKPGERRADAGSAPGDSRAVGTAPNGEPLYAAEWYREPTDQELAFYRPKRMPESGG